MVNALGSRELTFVLAGNLAKAEVKAEMIIQALSE